MRKMFVFSPVALAGLAALAILSAARPASVNSYEYCLRAPSSSTPACFLTIEQCVVAIPAQGGSCTREPDMAEANASSACASTCDARPRLRRTD